MGFRSWLQDRWDDARGKSIEQDPNYVYGYDYDKQKFYDPTNGGPTDQKSITAAIAGRNEDGRPLTPEEMASWGWAGKGEAANQLQWAGDASLGDLLNQPGYFMGMNLNPQDIDFDPANQQLIQQAYEKSKAGLAQANPYTQFADQAQNAFGAQERQLGQNFELNQQQQQDMLRRQQAQQQSLAASALGRNRAAAQRAAASGMEDLAYNSGVRQQEMGRQYQNQLAGLNAQRQQTLAGLQAGGADWNTQRERALGEYYNSLMGRNDQQAMADQQARNQLNDMTMGNAIGLYQAGQARRTLEETAPQYRSNLLPAVIGGASGIASAGLKTSGKG